MSELTPTLVEDSIDRANSLLASQYGQGLEGEAAGVEIADGAKPTRDEALSHLMATKLGKGLFVSLSRYNANHFDEVVSSLVNHYVLVRGVYVNPSAAESALFPAVVSSDSLQTPDTVRLHVFQSPYVDQLLFGTKKLLAAGAQLETPLTGRHDSESKVAFEPEHLQAIATLAIVGDQEQVDGWLTGNVHPNHSWRKTKEDSVFARSMRSVLDRGSDEASGTLALTVTFNKDEILAGHRSLLWHNNMVGADERPAIAEDNDALLFAQAEALNLADQGILTRIINAT